MSKEYGKNKAYWGDWVRVTDAQGVPIGEGVVQWCPIPGMNDDYAVDPTYGNGWSASGEYLAEVPESQIELVEQGWHQKWEKRVFRR